MAKYTVTLTSTEDLALSYVAASQQDWIDNVVHERARVATDEIVAIAVQKYLEANQTIPGSKDEIVQAAFDNGWVTSASSL